ncbi:uncharacterized protein LOC111372763 [Olea europaea subsp. europaea]|uniref:Uncharacterized protein LOC111372763 n=2 Tax=Olea europaea subsp. europaea TaxID=158383 RepID=A0A8S0T0S6_OLEEU|nr:uncharacterized protein LOC111372763 [Olea europaea subsp. europaea]
MSTHLPYQKTDQNQQKKAQVKNQKQSLKSPTETRSRKSHPQTIHDRHKMIEDRHARPPHAAILAVVVVLVMVVPTLLGDQGEALTEFIAEMLSPVGLLLLPIILLLIIRFLSSDSGSFVSSIFSTGEPNTIHRVSGSPVGVALVLVLVLFLLYNRVSIFGGDDDSGD